MLYLLYLFLLQFYFHSNLEDSLAVLQMDEEDEDDEDIDPDELSYEVSRYFLCITKHDVLGACTRIKKHDLIGFGCTRRDRWRRKPRLNNRRDLTSLDSFHL